MHGETDMHKMGLTSIRMYDKLCSDQIMIQEPHQVWYTYVMRGLAAVTVVKWKSAPRTRHE